MSKRIAIAAVLIAIATPALAEEFFVGQDPESKRCKIVTEKPDGQTMVMIGTEVLCHQGRGESRQEGRGRVPEEGKAN